MNLTSLFTLSPLTGKMVDMAEEVTCFSGSNKGSNSEVQSLSSFQSDSCDDNGKIAHKRVPSPFDLESLPFTA